MARSRDDRPPGAAPSSAAPPAVPSGGIAADPEGPGAPEEGRPGLLIALEGIDGSGKSTQARLLKETLEARGLEAAIFREPGDTPQGDRIRRLFQEGRTATPEEEMRLFLEDRRLDVRDNIGPALAAGKVVVMDRYYFSSMAYQGALGLDPREIRRANEAFAPRPDLTLVLDVPPDTGVARIHARRDVPNSFERTEYLARVRELFLSFCDGDVVCIDATGEPEAVGREIWRRVERLLRYRGMLEER